MPFCDKAHNKSMKKKENVTLTTELPQPNSHHHISLKLVSQKKSPSAKGDSPTEGYS